MEEPSSGGTLSYVDDSSDSLNPVALLFLQIECDQPLEPPVRHSLEKLELVTLGRGAERTHRRLRDGGVRRLEISLADRWMSSAHARLVREEDGWLVEDLGSKNGTIVNGVPCQRTMLLDGDIVEVGHALFLYRETLLAASAAADLDADQLRPPVPELRTFVAALAEQLDGLARVAGRPRVSVMVSGDSGTGKELVARAVHRLSGRAGALVAVNCGSLPAALFEAELFGYRKGAFSGAGEDRPGLVRAADGGTLFLDEIGDLSASSQVALLRVLEEHEVLPLGATRPVKVDLRLVTATHRSLSQLVEKGLFREDLLARLSGLRILLPPLRERREDLGLLIGALLRRAGPEPARVKLTIRAARALYRYHWPMNVRELEKCLTTAVALAGDAPLDLAHLPDAIRHAPDPAASDAAPPAAEDDGRKIRILALLREHRGNIAQVARAMAKAPMQIHRWIKRYTIDLAEYRPKK